MHKETTYLPQKANAVLNPVLSPVLSPVLVKQANLFADLPEKLIEDFEHEFQLNEWHKGDYINCDILTKRFFVLI